MEDKSIRMNLDPIFNAQNPQMLSGIFVHFEECIISRTCKDFSAFSFSNCSEQTLS